MRGCLTFLLVVVAGSLLAVGLLLVVVGSLVRAFR